MLPHIGQHNLVHHCKVGVKKYAAVVKNSCVQRQCILVLRLIRTLLSSSLGHHAEYEVSLYDSHL